MLGRYFFDTIIFRGPLGRRLDALGAGSRASMLRISYVVICFVFLTIVGAVVFAFLNRSGWLGAL
jgi:hypothetical protein